MSEIKLRLFPVQQAYQPVAIHALFKFAQVRQSAEATSETPIHAQNLHAPEQFAGLKVKISLTTVASMSTIAIDTRRARASDAFAISGVHESSWRHAYSGLIPHKALDTMVRRRDPKWWARAIQNSTRILVLEVGQEIVGYATVGPNRVNELPQDGEVYELYLLPEYQGIGLGKQLFLAARSELKALGMTSSLVWVLTDNVQAAHFYANAGGKDVAEGAETFNGTTLSKVAYAWN